MKMSKRLLLGHYGDEILAGIIDQLPDFGGSERRFFGRGNDIRCSCC